MANMRTMMDDDPRPQAFALQLLGWNPCAGATRITGPKPTYRSRILDLRQIQALSADQIRVYCRNGTPTLAKRSRGCQRQSLAED
jgi:hypothetical protein